MLNVLFERYKSKKKKHSIFYENEFFEIRNEPLQILQIGIDTSLLVWKKYFQKSNIFCIDKFKYRQPKEYSFLDENRIYWCRGNARNKKEVDDIMKNYWNNPRFNIIIDINNNNENFRKYCIGNYYLEENNNVRIIK